MTETCVSYTGDRATVILRPGLLGVLFGYRPICIDLERRRNGTEWCAWMVPASGRQLYELDVAVKRRIVRALEFREVGEERRSTKALTGGLVAL